MLASGSEIDTAAAMFGFSPWHSSWPWLETGADVWRRYPSRVLIPASGAFIIILSFNSQCGFEYILTFIPIDNENR